MMRILVCGGRDFCDYNKVRDALEALMHEFNLLDEQGMMPDPDRFTIIHGGAKGADRYADDWCVVNWLRPEVYYANWKMLGKAAGTIRNQQMLDSGIDLVLAFPDAQSRGTWHMVKIARKAGVEVRIFEGEKS